jgi:ferredoxin
MNSSRIEVDVDLCEGHALCVLVAGSVFELNDDERAVVLDVELTDKLSSDVQTAIQRCPTRAISLRVE